MNVENDNDDEGEDEEEEEEEVGRRRRTRDGDDNNEEESDADEEVKKILWFEKILPLVDHFRDVSTSFIHTLGSNISIDEMIIRFMGRLALQAWPELVQSCRVASLCL